MRLETSKKNPMSQNFMAKKFETSQSSINRIIHDDLNKKNLQENQSTIIK